MVYIIFALVVLLLLPVISHFKAKGIRRKKHQYIQGKWGKPLNAMRNRSLIESYLIATAQAGSLEESTINDLDIESIFAYIDRTNSKPGQQYLYKKLHEPEIICRGLQLLDSKVEKIASNRLLQEELEMELTELNDHNAYYLHHLFTKAYYPPFGNALTFYTKISAITIIVLAVLLCLSVNQFYFLGLLGMVVTNLVIHYKCKNRIHLYSNSLPQLLKLTKVAANLLRKTDLGYNNNIKNSLSSVANLKRLLAFVNFDSGAMSDQTDILYAFWELIKIFLLLEPLMFIISLNEVTRKREAIEQLFNYVGEVDMLITIQSVRLSLPYCCKPVFTTNNELKCEALYHPLIENCVPNNLKAFADKGVLITGSNMSGKTTFIRAVAINALLSQTLYTSCCSSYTAPLLKLHTSIRINDDLHEQKSYFQAEALSVLKIIEACEKAKPVKSLVIIDEIFKGTNTIERIAAAKAVLAHLTAAQNFVLVSTHDLELAELLGTDYSVYSFEESVAEKRLVFDYLMKPGLLKNKNGIAILKSLGYPDDIVLEAGIVGERLREKYKL